LVALTAFGSFVHAQAPPVLSSHEIEALLTESGKALQSLVAARNQSVPPPLANRKDRLGHTLKDDLLQNVLPPEVQTHLETLNQAAATDLRAGDLPGAQLNVTSLRRELATEIERFQAIVDYWKEVPEMPLPTLSVRSDALGALGIGPLPRSKEAAELQAQFDQQIAARDFTTAMRVSRPKYTEAAKRARAEEAEQILAGIDSGALKAPLSIVPARRCSPTKETSHADLPTIRVRSMAPTIEYYPKKLASKGIVGSPEVFIVVNDGGCPERSVLIMSSGYPEMDSAALQYVADGSYLPAEKDGMPARSGFSFRVYFSPPPRH
jgi:TonB family protein